MVEIQDIIWIDVFIEKIWKKHHVTIKEVEDVLDASPMIRYIEKGDVKGEDIYAAMGQTENGRYITVFFIRKANNRALIISARDMSRKERSYYEKRK